MAWVWGGAGGRAAKGHIHTRAKVKLIKGGREGGVAQTQRGGAAKDFKESFVPLRLYGGGSGRFGELTAVIKTTKAAVMITATS